MRAPTIVDLIKNPKALAEGDIIGFNQFPGHSKTAVKGSSGLNISQFNATVQEPSFRGFILSFVYRDDNPRHIVVMPLAPILKGERIPNDDKNLMITRKQQLDPMGLRDNVNWRLNYMPVTLEITPKNFSLFETGKIVKFGTALPELQAVIFGQVQKLMEKGILHSANFLPSQMARQLRGRETADYQNIAGSEARVAVYGNSRDAEALANSEAERAAEERMTKRNAKAEAARALREQMNASPSGKIAFKLGLRFNENANPDISLESALELGFIDEDMFLELDEMKGPLGYATLRKAFDTFRNDHSGVLTTLLSTGICTDNEEQYKAKIEIGLKDALEKFYQHLRTAPEEKPDGWETHVVPYVPAPAQDGGPK